MSNKRTAGVKTIAKSELDIPEIDWTGLYKRFMNDGELEVLIALVRSVSPTAVVEIGCNEGLTSKALLDNIPSIVQYYGIDVFVGYKFEKSVQRHECPCRPGRFALDNERFNLIVKDKGSFEVMDDELPEVDAVFIDGDHSQLALFNDTMLAKRKLRGGGIIIWHDYNDQGTVDVKPFVDELTEYGWPIEHVEGTWIAYMRVPKEGFPAGIMTTVKG